MRKGDVVHHALARRALLRSLSGGVEVCRQCGWNHLVRSYRAGTRQKRVRAGNAPP